MALPVRQPEGHTHKDFSPASTSTAAESHIVAPSLIENELLKEHRENGGSHPKSPSPRHHISLHRSQNGHGQSEKAVSPRSTNSGGFLLSPTTGNSRLTPDRNAFAQGSDERRSTRKRPSELFISKKRQHHVHRSSIGSSPLTYQVSSVANEQREDDVREHGKQVAAPSDSRLSRDTSAKSTLSAGSSQSKTSRDDAERHGYDTDPVQIVNMALSLSEGRRRQASAMRLAPSPGQARSFISGERMHQRPSSKQDSPSQPLFSRVFSKDAPVTDHSTDWSTTTRQSRVFSTSLETRPPYESHNGMTSLGDEVLELSDATLARVNKAKNHFTLLYEHFRLLPHLPPLRTPVLDKAPVGEGRRYNPLQFARNRKLRYKEKSIQVDTAAWHDSQRIHEWVDTVIEHQNEKRINPDECIRLPELSNQNGDSFNADTGPSDGSPASTKVAVDTRQSFKARRPRSDWVVLPGDLMDDVYWLEQGSNKLKIEDRNGNKIYPSTTKLVYVGWRGRTHESAMIDEQRPRTPSRAPIDATVDTPPPAPELPVFTSTGRHEKTRGRLRRRESKVANNSSDDSDSGSMKRRSKLKRGLLRTFTKEASSGSENEKSSRGRLRGSIHHRHRILEETKKRAAEIGHKLSNDDMAQTSESNADRRRSSVPFHTRSPKEKVDNELLRTSTMESASSQKRSISDQGQKQAPKSKKRPSRLSLEAERPPRTSLEYDSTAPSSPSAFQFPSLAFNFSPPPSRSPSPTKRILQHRMKPFRERGSLKPRPSIDNTDGGDGYILASGKYGANEPGNGEKTPADSSRDPSPMTKTASRKSTSLSAKGDSPQSQVTAFKPMKSPPAAEGLGRIRGLFKGGRIAQLVENEVSRVGDYIWKREVPTATQESSTSSTNESESRSETEDEGRETIAPLKKLPRPTPSRNPSKAQSRLGDEEDGFESDEKASFFLPHLPSFTSPFQRDRDLQERDRAGLTVPGSAQDATGFDHISQAAAQHRSISKSPRLNQLAPPKLTITRSHSSTASPDHNPAGAGQGLQLTKSISASLDLNNALAARGSRPSVGSRHQSLAALPPKTQWSPQIHPSRTAISLRDIARARALLLSSGSKARHITLIASLVRPSPPAFLLSLLPSTPAPSASTLSRLCVPRKEEFVLFGTLIHPLLQQGSSSLTTATKAFTTATTPPLHASLARLSTHISSDLFPRVGLTTDSAAALGTQIATTCALVTKALNDDISRAMRQKRRRGLFRVARRVGYGVVEWLVVALLWGIWFVVSSVRLGVGVIRGVIWLGRWALWID